MLYGVSRLNKDITDSIRGFAAIIILLHHISFRITNIPIWFKLIWYIAFPVVGLFFFLSGYGLTIGASTNKKYFNSFLSKRISRIIIPYLIVAIIWLVIEIFIRGEDFKTAFLEAFSIKYIPQIWFLWVIFVLYISYYIVFRYFGMDSGIYIFSTLIIMYILISPFFNPHDEMYASIIGMPAGIIYAQKEKEIDLWFKNNCNKKIIVSVVLFSILFIGRLYLSYSGIDNMLLHTILRNIITVLFVTIIIEGCKITNFKNKYLVWFGTISYEIYIIHPFILYWFERKQKEGTYISNCTITFVTILFTVCMAVLLNIISKKLFKIFNKRLLKL